MNRTGTLWMNTLEVEHLDDPREYARWLNSAVIDVRAVRSSRLEQLLSSGRCPTCGSHLMILMADRLLRCLCFGCERAWQEGEPCDWPEAA